MRSLARPLAVFLSLAPIAHAESESDAVDQTRAELRAASGAEIRMGRSPSTGLAAFMSAERGRAIAVPGPTAEARARLFLSRYGRAFGVRNDAASLATVRVREKDAVGMDHVRLQQMHQGVPVAGAELIVHLKGSGVVAVNGRTVADLDNVDMSASLSRTGARERARRALARVTKGADVTLSEPRLEILNRGLFEARKGSSRLAWYLEASGLHNRERIWIDARTGQTLLRFSQLTDAKKRMIYDGHSLARLPGTKIRNEGKPATGDPDADLAYQYLGDTYDYYATNYGRDSFDNLGGVLKATVHHCPDPGDCPFQNAFWNGSQMVFGDGFSAADDVDAHELTHAVTEREAGLFYYMQSGSLNESFSDIFGESVDQLNGSGTDTPAVKWLMGEDVPVFGALRNMADPTAFGDPGKMSDPMTCDQAPFAQDQGGVHSNSGIPNHAYALMVDGGTFNTITVTGIGLAKAGQIEYRALTQYLSSASDFLDDYGALIQSCADLIGTSGITSGDCTEVENALNAVEMAAVWNCAPEQAAPAEFCDGGNVPKNVFFDNLDRNGRNWKVKAFVGPKLWFASKVPLGPFATSGTGSLWGYDAGEVAASYVEMKTGVTIPPDAFLRFNHSFGFDNFLGTAFDGGLLAYTFDGASYGDLGPLIDSGAAYNATIASPQNPADGAKAFGFASWGYTSTRVDLSSLVNTTPRFAFLVATDEIVDDYGWYVDDVQIYTCQPPPPVSISDASKKEGRRPGKLSFTVSLGYASGAAATVHYHTEDVTATTADNDYVARSGILTFAPGVTSLGIDVAIIGDRNVESSETFRVVLDSPSGAVLGDAEGIGTLVNDDF